MSKNAQQGPDGARGVAVNGSDQSSQARGRINPRVWVILALLAVIAGGAGVRFALWSAGHESTDDASVTTDTVQISAQVSGTVKRVLVAENQEVKAGQPIALLDDAPYRAAVAQDQANLDAAIAQAEGAGVSVDLTQETAGAQQQQALGGVSQADSGVAAAQQDAARAAAGVLAASAQARGARSSAAAAAAGVPAALANRNRAAASVAAARAQVDTASAAVAAAEASVTSAEASADKTAKDARRYHALLAQGAVGEQVADQANAAATAARAALDAARQQVASAKAAVAARQSDVDAARAQLRVADTAVTQAKAQAASAKDAALASDASVAQARAASAAARQSIQAAEAKRQQALGALAAANTTRRQVAVSRSTSRQALARIEQARAALQQARLQLSYTQIVAPVDGRVSKKSVQEGALVQPGTPLVALVRSGEPWVVANFKETQMGGIMPGRRATIEVDAIPGHSFHGRVESTSAATGATFALLPADNATGNFTKVVQRVPVKIILDAAQPDMERLRAGMSVTAIVKTR